ncbi:Ribosome biogenesis protein ERB1 [Porphyridium purpureum]|uniref:Ribosome biogenesis protein ERB1 n=1 Tax=Porphyridium purpureum TaxID=35688 RepID=A0A5J4YQI0_PORPP|nr:Ribosome biogenesis protein ERB1 [Porphyridium purpureum]|eukprot:POR8925..scf222_8
MRGGMDDRPGAGGSRAAMPGRQGKKLARAVRSSVRGGALGSAPPAQQSAAPHADHDESASSSEDELYANKVGNIPMRWYETYDHIGYNAEGRKVMRAPRSDAQRLADLVDPESWRKVYDEKNDTYVMLTDAELNMIARLRENKVLGVNEEEVVAWSGPVMQTPAYPLPTEPKRRFQPSKHEAKEVVRLVRAIRNGWKSQKRDENDLVHGGAAKMYDLWVKEQTRALEEISKAERTRQLMHASAPKLAPPTHQESYNPPEEYLPTPEEAREWMDAHPHDRETNFLPTKYGAFRHVPLYENGVKERFERCLDLYLATRTVTQKLRIDPESLIPRIQKPSELRPFPTGLSGTCQLRIPGKLRAISLHCSGRWLLAASTQGAIAAIEIPSGRVANVWHFDKLQRDAERVDDGEEDQANASSPRELEPPSAFLDAGVLGKDAKQLVPELPVHSVRWCPRADALVFAAGYRKVLYVVDASRALGASESVASTSALLMEHSKQVTSMERQKNECVWAEVYEADASRENGTRSDVEKNSAQKSKHPRSKASPVAGKAGDAKAEQSEASEEEVVGNGVKDEPKVSRQVCALVIGHSHDVKSVDWHKRGDYVVCATRDTGGGSILMHRISRRQSQRPCPRAISSKAQIVLFHPSRPYLFVASQQHVRVFHLVEQKVVKKLSPGVKWISSLDVHPSGDHLLVGAYDARVCWMDLDLGDKPYRVLKSHKKAVRAVGFHPSLPLFADVSDDLTAHVFHGSVFDDLSKNALIVPVKILKGVHKERQSIGIVGLAWHPRFPWLITAGVDNAVHIMTDLV